MKKNFGIVNAAFVGLVAALVSAVVLHYVLGKSELLTQMGWIYLPYIISFFVGTTVTGLCLKATVKTGEPKQSDS